MRTFLLWLSLLTLSCSSAFANCGSEQASCTAGCVVGAVMTKQFGGGNDCVNSCLTAANACEAREEQQKQAEEQQRRMVEQRRQALELQRQQAEQLQAQQVRDAKEAATNREKVQQAGEVAQRVAAENSTQHQFDTAMEKGMQALDQKGYISAEFQFKTALKIRPNDLEAKAGQLRAILGAGKRATALSYANEQLLIFAAQPPGGAGRSTYSRWLEILADNGLVGETERGQLERIYPFAGGDPASAAATFPKANPKSAYLPFVRQIASVLPAIRAEQEDRREAMAKRKKDEDEAWKLAQKTATHAAMQAYINRYPNGRYMAQAREKDQEYQRPPPRPNLPFGVDESVWRILEASEAYRNAPRPRASHKRTVFEESKEFGLNSSPEAPTTRTSDATNEPISERCSVVNIRDAGQPRRTTYACGGIILGILTDSIPTSSIKALEPISGSLYPLRVGAEQRWQYVLRTLRESPPFDSHTTLYCKITAHLDANQLNSNLTGRAWVIRCSFESKNVYSNLVSIPITSESEDYLIEDLGVNLSSIGEFDYTTHHSTIPMIGSTNVLSGSGYRITQTYRSHEWAVGEADAQSAPALPK